MESNSCIPMSLIMVWSFIHVRKEGPRSVQARRTQAAEDWSSCSSTGRTLSPQQTLAQGWQHSSKEVSVVGRRGDICLHLLSNAPWLLQIPQLENTTGYHAPAHLPLPWRRTVPKTYTHLHSIMAPFWFVHHPTWILPPSFSRRRPPEFQETPFQWHPSRDT